MITKMKFLAALVGLLALFAPAPVIAQELVVNSCGAQSWVLGLSSKPFVFDKTGNLCTNASGGGGGGGGAITAASGAFASGSIASGAAVDLGAQADAACGTATGTCSAIALLKFLNTSVSGAIPAGTNVIGHVIVDTAPSTAVTGTFWQATQPVSGTFWQTTQPVSLATAPTTPVTGTFWQATQPVSIASLPSGAVTNAGTFAVQAAATLAAETTKVIGTVNQGGTWTVQPGNTANTTAWKVDGSAVTQPVSVASIPSHAVTNAGTFAVQTNGFTSWAGGTLGAMANYGTSPGTVLVPGVNNFQTGSTPIGAPADTVCATATGTCSLIALQKYSNSASPTLASQYPATAVPITASATGTTAATTATLTNVSGHTTYICGYSIRANATAAATVTDTITGVITATMSSILWVAPLASGIGIDENIFTPCIPASAVSTSIAVVSGAPGVGGMVSVRAWGYSL